jgi:hypothetical protein
VGRDSRHPSGHDPPPGWVGGFYEIRWGMACCLRAVSCVIGGLPPHRGCRCQSANAP